MDLLEESRKRIARRWARRLRADLFEHEVSGRDLRAPLVALLDDLLRLVRDRGDEGIELWAERMRAHGVRRYEQRFEADDLAREMKWLQITLLEEEARRSRTLDPTFVHLVAELAGEATASVEAAFARLLQTESARSRDAALMESVLHHIAIGILLAEPDGTVTWASPPAAALLGVPLRALLGMKSDGLGAILTRLHARHLDGTPFRGSDLPFVRALASNARVRGAWLAVRRADGSESILEMEATPLVDESGVPWAVIQTIADRTDAARKNRELYDAWEKMRGMKDRLAAGVSPGTPPPAAHTRAAGNARRVLVVDDDAANTDTLAEVLREDGYEVDVANDAASAMRAWKVRPHDAVLLDAVMPDRSGWDLAQDIRTLSPRAVLAMISGTEISDPAKMALVDAIFRKPLDLDALDDFLSRRPSQPGESPAPSAL